MESTLSATEYPRFQYFSLMENSGGPAKPINAGIYTARSEYIAILEQDDVYEPNYLEKIAQVIKGFKGDTFFLFSAPKIVNAGEEAVDTSYLQFDASNLDGAKSVSEDVFRVERSEAYAQLITGNISNTCSTFVMSKSTWEKCGRFDEALRTCIDYSFIQNVACMYDLLFLEKDLVQWHLHDVSLTKQSSRFLKSVEMLQVLDSFDLSLLDAKAKTLLRKRTIEVCREAAYAARLEGSHRDAREYLTRLLMAKEFSFVLKEVLKGLYFRAAGIGG